ncbi:MAG: cysteine desulfurase [Puniceicoccales bacterium]|jgi:cysteine desulfurase|nr:cysteine desulfurase [Puniceicoccales bacterium]
MKYFDANATTPLHPGAREAWLRAEDILWYNPASPTEVAARVYHEVEKSREFFAKLFGVSSRNVIFTSGATEANNAITAYEAERNAEKWAIVSAVEHPSVLEPAKKYWKDRLEILPVNDAGVVDLAELEMRLRGGRIAFVSIMAANNETGVIQPVDSIAALARTHGARYHCDATQWIGKLPLEELCAVDYLVGCAHKFGGPKGVGFMIFNEPLVPHFHGQLGGGHENHHRAGTVNFSGIAAMQAALLARQGELVDNDARLQARNAFEQTVLEKIPGAHVFGIASNRLWNTCSLALPRHANLRWLKRLEKHGFVVSTGSACATADNKPSHVLSAMGVSDDTARRTLRISSLWETTPADWTALADALGEVARELDDDAANDKSGVIVLP